MDYGVQFNKVFYERLMNGEDITLFSPSDVPELWDTFFTDVDKFRELYEAAERKTSIRKKKVSAIELFSSFMQERKDTGRIYLMNVDHANDHGSFKADLAPIRQSNLCCEINLPTKPLEHIDDPSGEISLCTLAAVNWGAIKKPSHFRKPAELLVRALDELLNYQDYPVFAAERSTMNRRPLGVGIINFAYWMAKNDMSYSKPNLEMIDKWAEHWSYYLIKASNELAKEKGACKMSYQTKYAAGILPKDTYKKEVDELVNRKLSCNWDKLSDDLQEHGIRNSTLMALMPSETSSQISNATNGIEPPRALLSIKKSKKGHIAVINTNLSSVFNLTKASIKTFLKQRNGSIINISSVVGVKGNAGQSNYSASKAGIIGFSKSIALELGSRNIRSNVIAPGFIETDMTDSLPEDVINSWKESIPLKRGGNPSDVGNACVFLASDLSSYITGQVLHVDGGMLT